MYFPARDTHFSADHGSNDFSFRCIILLWCLEFSLKIAACDMME